MSGATEDLFDVLSGELTALRRSVEHYGRATLSKNEARDLNKALVQAVDRMEKAVQRAPQALQETLKADRERMARDAAQAAREAAERVMGEIRGQLRAERLHFAQSAGEARRAVWRSFGGFWVWLLSMLATGVAVGALGATWINGRDDAKAFGRYPELYCETAGGQEGSNSDRTGCVFWYD